MRYSGFGLAESGAGAVGGDDVQQARLLHGAEQGDEGGRRLDALQASGDGLEGHRVVGLADVEAGHEQRGLVQGGGVCAVTDDRCPGALDGRGKAGGEDFAKDLPEGLEQRDGARLVWFAGKSAGLR